MSPASAEELLFTDEQGQPAQLQDVMAEGLEGGSYHERIPALIQLLHNGSPREKLFAAALLVAWGQREGFEALVSWARQPDQSPWHHEPITYHRIWGVDAAYELLAEALQTSFYNDTSAELQAWQVEAARALLQDYSQHHYGQMLMLALANGRDVAQLVQGEIAQALDHGIERLAQASKLPFDLGDQLVSLLAVLVRLNEEQASHYARALWEASLSDRARRELIQELSRQHDPATLAALKSFQQHGTEKWQAELDAALDRR